MQDIIIDQEFKLLLPELDAEVYESLEENIIQNGCLFPLVVWGNILVDGYHRYRICTTHDIPFKTTEKDFSNREEAIIWIITNQVSRRNLAPIQLCYFRGLHYRTDKRLVPNENGRNQYSVVEGQDSEVREAGLHEVGGADDGRKQVRVQNEPQAKNDSTAIRLAKKYNVSRSTIKRDAKISIAIDAIGEKSPDAKRDILSGKIPISRAQLKELASGTDDDFADVAASIADGSFERKKPEAASSASGGKPDDSFLSGFESVGDDSIEAHVSRLAEQYVMELQRITRGNSVELKEALRESIRRFEDYYKRV